MHEGAGPRRGVGPGAGGAPALKAADGASRQRPARRALPGAPGLRGLSRRQCRARALLGVRSQGVGRPLKSPPRSPPISTPLPRSSQSRRTHAASRTNQGAAPFPREGPPPRRPQGALLPATQRAGWAARQQMLPGAACVPSLALAQRAPGHTLEERRGWGPGLGGGNKGRCCVPNRTRCRPPKGYPPSAVLITKPPCPTMLPHLHQAADRLGG